MNKAANGASAPIRKAFVMCVNPGVEAEYARRHQPIWPELQAIFREHGVVTYSIFLEPQTRQLFGYAEVEDEAQWDSIAQTAACQKWWAYMKELMPTHPDNSPVSIDLKPIFHFEK